MCEFDAILFDMDGLLLDTEAIALSVFAEAIERANFEWSPAIGQQLIGRNAHDGDQILTNHYGPQFDVKTIRENFIEAYEKHLHDHEVPKKPGAEDLLVELQRRQLPRAVVTSSRRRLTDLKLIKSGFAKFFSVQICGDEIKQGKPDPEGYLLAAKQLNIQPERCLVLEDSAPGIQAASAAGMTAWWVPDQKVQSVDQAPQSIVRCVDLHEVKQRLFE